MSLENFELLFTSKEILEGRGSTKLVPREEISLVPERRPLLAMFLDGTESGRMSINTHQKKKKKKNI
jgi:hypothetical protein